MNCKYSIEERQKIIERYISDGETVASIIASTVVPKSTFYSWLKTYR